jgi:molybdopterin molybdotransferase
MREPAPEGLKGGALEAERVSVSVAEAREIILGSLRPLPDETVGLHQASGRVLAEEILSPRRIPPHDNSGMDGYALRAEDVRRVPARLRIVAEIPAGARAARELGGGDAARILTGAPIPPGADAVVMQEHTEVEGRDVVVLKPVAAGENVRRAGSDVQPGTRIAAPGTRLRPALIGMLAALGRTQVAVVTRPRVAVLATGDELVEPDRLQDDGRIASSNSYSLCSALQEIGADPVYLGIARDEPAVIRERFEWALRCDAVVSTGGVSVGDRDWIKQVLAGLGAEMRLWRVRMKPGAPLAFVMHAERPVFGLPGNPVSTLVTFEQFVRPALLRMLRLRQVFRPVERARLAQDYGKAAGRAHFVRVRLEARDGELHAFPVGDQSSAILLSMVRADGLAYLAEDETHFAAGTPVPVQLLDRDDLRLSPGI